MMDHVHPLPFWTGWTAFLVPSQRTRMQLRRRTAASSVVAIGAGIAVVATTGVAYAYMQVQASGSTRGSAIPAAATVTATGATLSGSLYPGGPAASLTVSISNPYNEPLTITGVAGVTGSPITANGASGTCSTTGVSLVPSATPSPSSLLANASSTQIVLSGAVKMDGTSDSGCQGATFTVPLVVTLKIGSS